MNKKYLILLLALTLPLVACEGDDASTESTDGNQVVTTDNAPGNANENTLEETVENTAENVAESAVRIAGDVGQAFETAAANVEDQLNRLDFEEATEENYAEVQNALADTREELAASYENADEQAQETWATWEQEFEEVETALENGTEDALEDAQNLLENIQNNLDS